MAIGLLAQLVIGQGILSGARALGGRKRNQQFAQALLDATTFTDIDPQRRQGIAALATQDPSLAMQLLNQQQKQQLDRQALQRKTFLEERKFGLERERLDISQSAEDRAQVEANRATQEAQREAQQRAQLGQFGGVGAAKPGPGQRFVTGPQGNVIGIASIPNSKLNRELEDEQLASLTSLENVERISEITAALTQDQLLDPSNPLTAELGSAIERLGGQIRAEILKSGVPSEAELALQARIASDPTQLFNQITQSKTGALSTLANVERFFAERLSTLQRRNVLEPFGPDVQPRTEAALGRVGQASAPFQRVQDEAQRFGVDSVSAAREVVEAASTQEARLARLRSLRTSGLSEQELADRRFQIQRLNAAERFLENRPRLDETGDPVFDRAVRNVLEFGSDIGNFVGRF